jgi:hypothetical protein
MTEPSRYVLETLREDGDLVVRVGRAGELDAEPR